MKKTLYIMTVLILLSMNHYAQARWCESLIIDETPVSEQPRLELPWVRLTRLTPMLCRGVLSNYKNEKAEEIDSLTFEIDMDINYISDSKADIKAVPTANIPFDQWYEIGVKSWVIGMQFEFIDTYGDTLFYIQKDFMADSNKDGDQSIHVKLDLSKKIHLADKIAKVSIKENKNYSPPKFQSTYLQCTNGLTKDEKAGYENMICGVMNNKLFSSEAETFQCGCKTIESSELINGNSCFTIDCDLTTDDTLSIAPPFEDGSSIQRPYQICEEYDSVCDQFCRWFPTSCPRQG